MFKNDYTKFSNRQMIQKVEKIKEDLIDTKEEPKHGIVTDCVLLNVRKEPDSEAEVLCRIDCSTDLMIYEKESTEDFYKVCTAAGVEGFCMRKFITLVP